jgi:hypothetical protein
VRSLRGKNTWQISRTVDALVAGGWLIEEKGASRQASVTWTVARGLRDAFAKKAAAEAKRKAETKKLIQKAAEGRP